MSKILYILLALAILLVLITVHEFGHYCAGKIFGFKINEFSIGFGPTIYKRKQKNGEQFSIRALPLGGYCAFEGEDEDGKDVPGSFNTMPAWKRLVVLLAGVTFNFMFGVLTACIFLATTGYSTIQMTTIKKEIATESGTQIIKTIGIEDGDILYAINGKRVEAYRSHLDILVDEKDTEEFVFTVIRNGEKIDIMTKKQDIPAFYYISDTTYFVGKIFEIGENGEAVALDYDKFSEKIISIDTTGETTEGNGDALKEYLGTVYKDSTLTKTWADEDTWNSLFSGDSEKGEYPVFGYAKASHSIGMIYLPVAQDYTFFESVARALPYCLYLGKMIIVSLGGLFSGAVSVSEAGGTITAVSQIAEYGQMSLRYLLLFLPLLSMNLAIFNVLPIPSLDGARAVFVFIEIIFRKPVPRKIEGIIHTVGLIVLLGLVVFLDVNHFIASSIILQL